MRKARDLIGLPVLTVDAGKQIGQVKDVCMDPNWNIIGIVLETKQWFSAAKLILWNDIIAVGTDAVTIPNESVLVEQAGDKELIVLNDVSCGIKGLPVITVDGRQLGMVEDVYLGQDWGTQIVGYELSEGFISDLKGGRRWLPVPESAVKGKDAVIVPAHAAAELEELFVSKEE